MRHSVQGSARQGQLRDQATRTHLEQADHLQMQAMAALADEMLLLLTGVLETAVDVLAYMEAIHEVLAREPAVGDTGVSAAAAGKVRLSGCRHDQLRDQVLRKAKAATAKRCGGRP